MEELSSNAGKDFFVSPTISKMPFRCFAEFKRFAEQHAGDSYWVAIALLLERSKRLEVIEGLIGVEENDMDEEQGGKPVFLGDDE